jgi:thiol:disulfide interchange protein
MIAAFFVSPPTRAETAAAEPAAAAEAATQGAASPDVVPAQTVSAVTPSISPPAERRTMFAHASYPAAWTAAQKSNRPILLYITMSGCPHCEQMIDQTYHLPKIEHMVAESFESIKVNGPSQPALVKALKVKWYPTTILVGTNNKVVDVIEGYVDADTFQRRLQTGLASAESSTQTR